MSKLLENRVALVKPSCEPRSKSLDRRAVAAAIAMCVTGFLGVAAFGGARAAGPATGAPASDLPAPGTYALDPPHTFVYFAAQHQVVGMVRGRFNKMSGTIIVATDPAACAVDVSIEAASVDTQNGIRDDDLRSAAFFYSEKFPAIRYHGKGIRRSGDRWLIDGLLTIRGVEKTVPLEFVFKGTAPSRPSKPNRVAFHANASAKRADFGMTRELLDEIGKSSAGPDVWIDIDAEVLGADRLK